MKKLINLKSVSFLASFVFILLMFSCTKEDHIQNEYTILVNELGFSANNEHIKFVSTNGRIGQTYFYDNTGKIVQTGSGVFCTRYIYDENDRLVKKESTTDRSIFSSTYPAPKTDYDVINNYSLYEYDKMGRLSKIENYSNIETRKELELRSIQIFEYEGKNIVKVNLCDPTGHINQYYVYTYDSLGNITNEKNYICMFTGLSNPELNYEIIYKYDNYKNPFQILNILAPVFYTGANNMIEMTTKWYISNPRTETAKQTFEYNAKGYPVKMTYDGGVEEYEY